ncbi:helix-turn-helix domain-containing protein [Cryobacterium sp. MDB1-18-2]|uniref:helix-turn-helix domain-containing protein n=1 Tax=unclassified Cryobacterium TaxID=2649013 RepID=UPI00106CE44C|nr:MULTISPECIES: helix-turn-helix domain-containing protein [unclassified Cryobacterium]TFC30089.1 helix-turn-helix domain-containing protein [Cryobacterium sp. MDB1-18-2]TFC41369.1 helix-turn-helix domain-containing protein [Cryobacterium sp. MDB1-18-1]
MSNKAITWAYAQTGLKAGPKFVLVTLADLADQEHSCFPGVPVLADLTGLSESGVRSQLDLLLSVELITRERRFRKDGSRTSNRYYLQMNPPVVIETPASDSGASNEDDQRQNLGGLAPDSGDPSVRIWGGILEPPVNPQIEPPVKDLIAHEPTIDEYFEAFYSAYPRHTGKAPARIKFAVAAKKLPPATLVAAAIAYRDDPNRTPDLNFVRHPATWLHQEGWDDVLPDRAPPPSTGPSTLDHNRAIADQFRQKGQADGPGTDRRSLDNGR